MLMDQARMPAVMLVVEKLRDLSLTGRALSAKKFQQRLRGRALFVQKFQQRLRGRRLSAKKSRWEKKR